MARTKNELPADLYMVYEELAPRGLGLNISNAACTQFNSCCPIHGGQKKSDLKFWIENNEVMVRCKVCGDLDLDTVLDAPTALQEAPKTESLPLGAIQADTRTQSRAAIDATLVAEYAQLLSDGVVFPPLVVFFDSTTHWLSEGFHRYHAYQ